MIDYSTLHLDINGHERLFNITLRHKWT
jgi:hypothetical protein